MTLKFGAGKKLASLVVGSAILAWCAWYLYRHFEWAQVLRILSRTNLWWFFGVGGLSLLAYNVARAYRWRLMLPRSLDGVPFLDLYLTTAASLSLAMITPGQSGEAMKIELLRRQRPIDRRVGYGSFLVERVVDLLIVTLMGLYGLITTRALLPNLPSARGAGVVVATLSGVVAIALVWAYRRGWLQRVVVKLRTVTNPQTLLRIVLISVVCWFFVTLQWWALLRSIGMEITPQESGILMALVTLGRILSMVPGGVGVSEVLSSELLQRMGQSVPLAQAGAMILRCQTLLILTNGLLHYVFWRSVRGRLHFGQVPAYSGDASG